MAIESTDGANSVLKIDDSVKPPRMVRSEPHLLHDARTHLDSAEVKTFKVRMMHDDCGGEFIADGSAQAMSPPNYGHLCNKCGGYYWLRGGARYPSMQYRVAGEDGLVSKL